MKPQVTTEHHQGQAKIFNNATLEKFTKSSLKSSVFFYGSIIAILIFNALVVKHLPWITFIIVFGFALFFWTLAEYLLHRYLFHWLSDNKVLKRFHFIVHGSHHQYPRDTERIVMPPLPGLILIVILFTIFYLLFSLLGIVYYLWAFFPGFLFGYLLYSFLHRAIHVIKSPKRFKYLWKHHTFHHYKYPNKAFGVSTLFWDRLFGTMPPDK